MEMDSVRHTSLVWVTLCIYSRIRFHYNSTKIQFMHNIWRDCVAFNLAICPVRRKSIHCLVRLKVVSSFCLTYAASTRSPLLVGIEFRLPRLEACLGIQVVTHMQAGIIHAVQSVLVLIIRLPVQRLLVGTQTFSGTVSSPRVARFYAER